MTHGDANTTIESTFCECKAGKGQCSHSIGLLYMLSHWQKLQLKSVPPVESKTSLPQQWHVPRRTSGLEPQEVMSMTVKKIKPPAGNLPPQKRARTVECVRSSLYCPVPDFDSEGYSRNLLSCLSSIKSSSQICQVLPPPTLTDLNYGHISTKYGDFLKGSVLSYQLPKPDISRNILHFADIQFPSFSLPYTDLTYSTVLSFEHLQFWLGIQVTKEQSLEYETITQLQSATSEWHSLRKYRLTSSKFKFVCARKQNFETLATRLVSDKIVLTKAMREGILKEPYAAESYATTTGNNVYLTGFIINPCCPHLGTSPDRGVYDPAENPPWGLLEIKCPDSDSFTTLKHLKKVGNIHKLKTVHDHYHQIMGQMAITGISWCDYFVFCRNDFHLERIYFDQDFWIQMKEKLDRFYFEYMLPKFV